MPSAAGWVGTCGGQEGFGTCGEMDDVAVIVHWKDGAVNLWVKFRRGQRLEKGSY